MLGLSYTLFDDRHLSIGGGAIVNKLITRRLIKSDTFAKYVAPETIDGAIGIFYDRNHSLLASIILTWPIYDYARMNIYPGWLSSANYFPGFFIGAGELDKFQIGITKARIPVGINYKLE